MSTKAYPPEFIKYRWDNEAKIEYEDLNDEEVYELYNLKNDSAELNNLVESEPAVFERLKKELKTWSGKTRRFDIKNTTAAQFSPEMLKKIREHGYW